MKPEEQNIAVAGKLRICLHSRTEHYQVQGDSGFTCLDCGKDTYGLKKFDFVSDANTRPQMLASLTREQKEQLIYSESEEQHYSDVGDHLVGILELTQPQFTELFLKVTNLWKD